MKSLDDYNNYWQVSFTPQDRHITSLVRQDGKYQYIKMTFGLKNAPNTYQLALDMVLTKFKWRTRPLCMDYVIIYLSSVEDDINHVDEILTTLAEADATLKMKICTFFGLGHVIHPGKLEVDIAHTASLQKSKNPSTKSELRSFLRFCNVYRRLILEFKGITHPLNQLLRKKAPDMFTLDKRTTETLQYTHRNSFFASNVDSNQAQRLYSVDTEVLDYGIGCTIFTTNNDGKRKLIGHWSRKRITAEKNHSDPDRECLTASWAFQTRRPYRTSCTKSYSIYRPQRSILADEYNRTIWSPKSLAAPSSRIRN